MQDNKLNYNTKQIRKLQDKSRYYKPYVSVWKVDKRRYKMKDQNVLTLTDPRNKVKSATVYIEGDGDLVCHKMCARDERLLLSEDRKKVKEVPNVWEDIITSVHWRDGIPCEDTYKECNEEMMHRLLKENAPCITAFGLKKTIGDAVVRNEIDKYRTKIDNALNIIANKGLVPVEFTEWSVDERLMAPKKGSPITVRLNHFSGWKANFRIDYTDHVYTLERIIDIINLAGFGLGIGSGRSSGFGRFHVTDVK